MKAVSWQIVLLLNIVSAAAFFSGHDLIADEYKPKASVLQRVKDGVVTLDQETFNKADLGLSSVMNIEGKLSVPASAILWHAGRPCVYVQVEAWSFRLHPVSIVSVAPEGIYEVTDLAPDASIVTRGAQMLLSEEFGGADEGGHH